MTFTEAFKACNEDRIVYYKKVPHVITYTTAGGAIIPPEGIAHIRGLNETKEREVEVINLSLTKINGAEMSEGS
ncbi:hypothetical protein [Sulfitobacter sp. R18_1]|uniref:hypothetical protein n=1 Tax=Sulfitobacter sp. R18_1 TaxID=2821104 RepID=UPI001ADBD66F|nr:hypothetical protein [Sulfitobacter sp. R18_1]MBO9428228.1 hypothetical protein [Sulfitobacter sp. R18_1]